MGSLIFIIILIIVLRLFWSLLSEDLENNSKNNILDIRKETERFDETNKNLLEELMKLPEKSTRTKGRYLVLDTETTGLPKYYNASVKNFDNWPYIVELAWMLVDEFGNLVDYSDDILKQNVIIPEETIKIHHITNEKMNSEGIDPKEALEKLLKVVDNCDYIVGHNITFDISIIQCEIYRNNINKSLEGKPLLCTMRAGSEFISFDKSRPKLTELFGDLLFDDYEMKFSGAHNALFDVKMTYRCLMEMINQDMETLIDCGLLYYSPYEGNNFGNGAEKLTGDILKKDLSNADPNSIFYNKIVVITGVFPMNRIKLAEIIKINMGADINTSVTKTTNYLICGDQPGDKKLELAKKNNIKIISRDEIMGLIKKYNKF